MRTGTPLCSRCLDTFERETRHCPDERANIDDYSVQGLFRYEGIAREVFGLAKFGGNRALADFLIERGMMRLSYPSDVHLWVPVPPERTRLLDRGFSLPDRMAWRIGKLTGIPCAIDGSSLHAEKEQKKLDRPGRLSERLHREWSGGDFLLITDPVWPFLMIWSRQGEPFAPLPLFSGKKEPGLSGLSLCSTLHCGSKGRADWKDQGRIPRLPETLRKPFSRKKSRKSAFSWTVCPGLFPVLQRVRDKGP